MTSERPNLHVSKNQNISKTKQDIKKLKTPLRFIWKCCSDALKIGSTIFRCWGTLILQNSYKYTVIHCIPKHPITYKYKQYISHNQQVP